MKSSTAIALVALASGLMGCIEESRNMKIVDVSSRPPADLATYPVEDSAQMKLTEGDSPRFGFREAFASKDGEFRVEYSQYETQTLKLTNWGGDEFMYILEGELEITDGDGVKKIYGPGDMFVMPKGFSGTWRQLSPIKKISATYGWSD